MNGVLLGRRAEVAAAVETLGGTRATLHVVGGAGYGKTRFVDEVLADPALRGRRVVRGVCQPPSVGAFPFGPVVDGLRAAVTGLGAAPVNPIVGVLRSLLPEVAELLPPVPECVGTPADRHLVFRAVRELLAALTPVVLVVEDAHWADADTVALLRFLTSTAADLVAVVLTYRPGPFSAPGTRVDLGPLTREDLLAAVAEEDVDDLLAHTGGVPYLVAAALRGGVSVPAAAGADVASRLAEAGPQARAVAVAAAVVGIATSAQVLARVGGVSGGRDAVVAALRSGVLAEHGPDAFRVANGVFQRVLHDELTGPERVELHRRALRALRGVPGTAAAVLAEHARLAGRLGDWVDHAEAVGTVEVLAGPLGEPALPAQDLCRLAIRYAREIGADGLPVLTRLVDDARLTDVARAEVRLGRGLLLVRGGHAEGVAEVERAVARLPEGSAARGMVVLATPTLGRRPVAENAVWMDQTERVLAAFPDLRAPLLPAVAANRLHTADPVAWDMIAMLPGPSPEVAEAAAWTGHHELARGHCRPGSAIELVLDFHSGQWTGLAGRAAASGTAEGFLVLAWLALATGDWVAAERNLAEIQEDASTPVALAAHAAAIRMWSHRDRPDEVDEAVSHGLRLLRDKGNWAWSGELVPAVVAAYCREGLSDQARDLTTEFLRHTASMNLPSTVADECRGMVAEVEGDRKAAATWYSRARRASPRHSATRHAESAARCGLPSSNANADLLTLVDYLDHLGATLDANRCRQLLRDNGAIPHLRRGHRSYGNQLSPRERDVVRLLAQHRTNQDIADVLFLSRRTVEQHVANVLRKLHLVSRHDVAKTLTDDTVAAI
ncbi:AAA family ATPase [Actinokineospora diospyrosa]|uniref:AAA ATPase domain-containing protein n=1 Tax=Actinokineospora diospyrosa TaxID=103728 RepID=A0ABT1I9N5_9PSEU|nr:LuxR family transcriptional regulator [Actinokineospora diospyrosa]MCP2269345.1 AAA ATPase domain-containing protein [Actinokineospora diospyrosa]